MARIKPHKPAMKFLRELKSICLQSVTVSCFRIAKQTACNCNQQRPKRLRWQSLELEITPARQFPEPTAHRIQKRHACRLQVHILTSSENVIFLPKRGELRNLVTRVLICVEPWSSCWVYAFQPHAIEPVGTVMIDKGL
jgi:hypothetical protein